MTKEIEKEELENNESEKIEVKEEEIKKVSIPPVAAKYTRPPAFQKQNNFAKWNQNTNGTKPVLRKWAGRGR